MGKRSQFTRAARDHYPTPAKPAAALRPHLRAGARILDPCVNPDLRSGIVDALGGRAHYCDARAERFPAGLTFVTNPPWKAELLLPILDNLSCQGPTWMLLQADVLHNRYLTPYLPRLALIVAIGRVKWFPDSPYSSKDNCVWLFFDRNHLWPTRFIGRAALYSVLSEVPRNVSCS